MAWPSRMAALVPGLASSVSMELPTGSTCLQSPVSRLTRTQAGLLLAVCLTLAVQSKRAASRRPAHLGVVHDAGASEHLIAADGPQRCRHFL